MLLEGETNVRRRTFCAVGLAAVAATSIPFGRARAGSSGSDIAAKGLDGRELALSAADVEDLRAGLRGELIGAGDPAYDAARRLWNPDFDLRPALIVAAWAPLMCAAR